MCTDEDDGPLAISVLSYDINLRLDDNETFQTTALLTAEANRQSHVIRLNCRHLSISPYVSVESRASNGLVMVSNLSAAIQRARF